MFQRIKEFFGLNAFDKRIPRTEAELNEPYAEMLPYNAEDCGIFTPFGYQGGHKWDMCGPRNFRCKVCGAYLYWRDNGLYEIMAGPIVCTAPKTEVEEEKKCSQT